jgi:tetratricopeptide (TPR) repeat protein
MRSDAHKRVRWVILPALALFVLLYPIGLRIENDPSYPSEYHQPIYNVREGGTIAIMAMMGGFRPMAANLLWLKADQYWHMGASGWWRMVPVLQTICELDPHFIDAWSTFGWHCAWNIYADAPPEDKPKWVQTGIDIYKRGIRFNPDKYDLYKDLAWLYHDKLKDYDRAIPAWQETLKQPDAPMYVRHMLAHCYEITWQVDKAIATWKECLRIDPKDHVAISADEWWEQQTSSPDKLDAELQRILERENRIRKSRRLPLMEQPFSIR